MRDELWLDVREWAGDEDEEADRPFDFVSLLSVYVMVVWSRK